MLSNLSNTKATINEDSTPTVPVQGPVIINCPSLCLGVYVSSGGHVYLSGYPICHTPAHMCIYLICWAPRSSCFILLLPCLFTGLTDMLHTCLSVLSSEFYVNFFVRPSDLPFTVAIIWFIASLLVLLSHIPYSLNWDQVSVVRDAERRIQLSYMRLSLKVKYLDQEFKDLWNLKPDTSY